MSSLDRELRVLHVLPHRGGGGENYVDMLERMSGVLHERRYLSAGRSPGSAAVSVPIRWGGLARELPAFDLLHVHGDAAALITLPLLARRPSVITSHGLHLWRRSTGLRRGAIGALLRAAAARSVAVVCTSSVERDELARLVRAADADKLRVIRNGTDAADPPAAGQREAVRSELGVGEGTVLGLFVGQLEDRKAPLLAAAAARQVRERGIDFVLAFAGAGPQAGELRALAGPAVRPMGFRSDLPRLMYAADVFIQPSEREGMSLALLDAMAHGLAVVAAEGPGNPEAVGDAGLLFPPGDQDALVEALTAICQDAQTRSSFGLAARARALSEFGAGRFVTEVRALYLDSTRSTTSASAAAGAG